MFVYFSINLSIHLSTSIYVCVYIHTCIYHNCNVIACQGNQIQIQNVIEFLKIENHININRQELELLADALLKYETLDADDIKCIIETKRPMPPR